MCLDNLIKDVYGSVLIMGIKEGFEENKYHPFMKSIRHTDEDDTHLFQRAEDCTITSYRPPDLSLKQLHEFRIHINVFKKGEYFYAISADAVNIIGKGTCIVHAIHHLLSIVKLSIRCGYGGVYPLPSNSDFQKRFLENFTKSFIDYNLVCYENVHNNHIDYDMQTSIRFDKEILTAIMIRRMLKKRLEFGDETYITYTNYLRWLSKKCPTRRWNETFGVSMYEKDITFDGLLLLHQNAKKSKNKVTLLKGINIKYCGNLSKVDQMF